MPWNCCVTVVVAALKESDQFTIIQSVCEGVILLPDSAEFILAVQSSFECGVGLEWIAVK